MDARDFLTFVGFVIIGIYVLLSSWRFENIEHQIQQLQEKKGEFEDWTPHND